MRLYHFPVRSNSRAGNGLFFCMPPEQQKRRIRELARARFTFPQIASITRMTLAEVSAILEAQA